jgi:uncharacterized protein YcaQ
MVTSVSSAQARRLALAASGFGRAGTIAQAQPAKVPSNAASRTASSAASSAPSSAPSSAASTAVSAGGAIGNRQLNATIARLGLIQLDSVNVFERSHYLPLFSRLGAYDKGLLDRLIFAPKGHYAEYWAHEAAIIPVTSWPLWRWKMDALRESDPQRYPWVRENTALLDWLRRELVQTGPITAGRIEHDATTRRGPWWGWSDVKQGLEFLFRWGDVVAAGRTRFERSYAFTEQIIPEKLRAVTISREDAHRQLIAHAAQALGIATLADLADYYRLKTPEVQRSVNELAEEGVLTPATVAGWAQPAWVHRDARSPRRIEATALLSPFDPLVWNRPRAERLFDFHYRIEIYTPAAKRVFGYYSLPILVDDQIVGRVDLKSDRQARVLRVQSAWHELRYDNAALTPLAERLADVLERARAWQNLDSIEVVDRGNLAASLASELATAPR